jgi:Mg2+ and Co2+ transporter CorA
MNVAFPGESTEAAFWAIMAGMAALFVGLVGFFRYKRWL